MHRSVAVNMSEFNIPMVSNNSDMTLPLIIFDCDGVLVDTEALTNNKMAEIFTSLGFKISGPDCRARFQGKSMEDVCAVVSTILNTCVVEADLQDQINQTLAQHVKPIPGVEQLVETLINSSYPICVASSGTIEKMHVTLGQTKLLPLLKDLLFSATQVKRGKPHPDVFEFAAKQMGANISSAIIIEDSVSGVLASKAAGARVLGYCGDPFTQQDKLAAAGADVFFDMKDVMDLISTS